MVDDAAVASNFAGSEHVLSLLLFLWRRVQRGTLVKHPLVRRILMLLAISRWVRRRFPSTTQQITLKKGETLRMEIVRSDGVSQ